MTVPIALILFIVAIICLLLAALPAAERRSPVHLGWMGMFFWALSLIIRE